MYPYNHYLFFYASGAYYRSKSSTPALKQELGQLLLEPKNLNINTYSMLGFKPNSTFMLWIQTPEPEAIQAFLNKLTKQTIGSYLDLNQTYFGIVRESKYSGRVGKPEQVMQNFDQRLKYLILYPFTKTIDWYLLDFENRKSIMGQHIKRGVEHPEIRQCLLYSYGLDDNEFLVSYETDSLEDFQDLVMEMRSTIGRRYTLNDTPVYTCVHKSVNEIMELL